MDEASEYRHRRTSLDKNTTGVSMWIFIIVYLLLYGGIHYWMTTSLLHAYTFASPVRLGLIIWMTLMVMWPMVLIGLERKQILVWLTRSSAWLTFTWMGIIFLMLVSFAVLSLMQGGFGFINQWTGWNLSSWVFSPAVKMTITLILVLVFSVLAFTEASHVRIERIQLSTPKFEQSTQTLRIVQISDLHLGNIIREDYAHKIIEKIKLQKPDLIVCTGDMVDAPLDHDGALANMFMQLDAPLGKYAILGNHEYIAGIQSSLKFLEAAGFEVLHDGKRLLANGVLLVGVDDPSGKYFGATQHPSEKELLDGNEPEVFRVLLKHRPVVEKERNGLFDLQLSGHTHKGQLFPFNIFTKLAFRYHSGLFEINQNQWIYVSRGTGTWGPPMRLFAAPEISVIDISSEK